LIRTKEHLVISLPFQNSAIDKVIATANTNAIADSRTTKNQHQKPALRKVVVDVREFRSTLPSILYMNDFQLVPRTITVGDYVLSSEICVERKGISDLFQSFSSGRLYNQVESMSKYYKYPCLLIEFSPDKAFCFMVCKFFFES
jgi:DNA excision repair protein ERCC-4